MHKVLVCIPAYNEGENISPVLDEIRMAASHYCDILVIDDGSQDNTREVCKGKGIPVISHIYNLGYGAALKTAYEYAAEHDYDFVIQMDADGQHDVINIERIYQEISSTDADIVIGSRFLGEGSDLKTSFLKKIAVGILDYMIKLTSKVVVTDPTSGLQGISRKAFLFYARFNHFSLDYPDANMIVQMALNKFNITEIPAIMHPRHAGKGMHSGIFKPIRYILLMTLSILIVRIREAKHAKGR
ncbi:MAG: glycosyltransferase family 2 protein [Oscillospiraceae bacterium]|nr:glycosyltransferase family 2 protein [Oscillospiraceae bacterium]